MTPLLRDRVLALAKEWTDPDCKACSVSPEFALAVMALVAEECAKMHDKEAAKRFTVASENSDLYRGYRNGMIRAAESIRKLTQGEG